MFSNFFVMHSYNLKIQIFVDTMGIVLVFLVTHYAKNDCLVVIFDVTYLVQNTILMGT